MYTTITKQHKDFENLMNNENNIDFIKTFENYGDITIFSGIQQYKYKKFKDYYIKYYYCNNYLKSITYYNYSGELHREDGPAFIEYYKNGNIWLKEYYLNGGKHREYGPALIYYYENGKIKTKLYYLNCKCYSYKQYIEKLKCLRQ